MSKISLGLLLSTVLLPGCAALSVRNDPVHGPVEPPVPVFAGACTDVCMVGRCLAAPIAPKATGMKPADIFRAPLWAVDIPFSFAVDVVYLPLELVDLMVRNSEKRPQRPAAHAPTPPLRANPG